MAQQTPKTNKPNHLKDLILLFAIPIAIAVIAALALYVPQLLAHPNYDFIYSSCENDYLCSGSYSVDAQGYVNQNAASYPYSQDSYSKPPTLKYYSAQNDSTRNISVTEARNYRLNSSSKSPDGYTLTKSGSGGGFLFFEDSKQAWYLQDGVKKKKVTLTANDPYSWQNVTFVGWVVK